MPTVLRVRGLRIVIYTRDHPPPHVHIIGPDREARILLDGPDGRPELVVNERLSRTELAAALIAITRNREMLIRRWREIHGRA